MVLTEDQQNELDATTACPVEMIDPRTGNRYCLIAIADYENLVDEVEQNRWARMSQRVFAKRLRDEESLPAAGERVPSPTNADAAPPR